MGVILYKYLIVSCQAQKYRQLRYVIEFGPFHDFLYFTWINFDSFHQYLMAEVVNFFFSKGALRPFCIELVSFQNGNNLTQVPQMILPCSYIYEDVIKKYQYEFSSKRLEQFVHYSLKCSWSVILSKGNYFELIVAFMSEKCGLLVFHSNFDLIIARSEIQF